MTQSLALLGCFFLFTVLSTAQVEVDENTSCGTSIRHDHLMRTDSLYKANLLRHINSLDSALQSGSHNRSPLEVDFTIPVVVHVIHLGEPVGTGSNIPDAQVIDAINGLNSRYANSNGQGVDTDITFCLATQAPDGCPTTGIMRVDGTGVANYAAEGIEIDGTCGANELAVKNLSRWPVLDYYNIWVVHDICGNYAGYAYYPNGGNLDGAVIGSLFMTSLGKTLSHELGHGLDIRHTFEGDGDGDDCPVNGNCLNNGDLICDTPPHRRDDCGATNPCTTEGIWDNSRYNWMSYCSTPVNQGRFTNGQRTRMHAAMNSWPREELQNSGGCVPVDLPEIISENDPMCEGEIRVLDAEPPGGVFIVLSGPGEIESDELTATGEGTITIQYSTCSFDVTQQIEAFDTPDPFFVSSSDPLCVGSSRLLSCEPPGGDFNLISGPASLAGNTVLAEEPGNVEIEYIITINGCTNNAFQEFEIVETPMPEITSSNASMCVGEERLLTGLPGGGEYFVLNGPGDLNGNELTATGTGTIIIEYTVEDNDCPGSTTQSIVVSNTPTASITSDGSPMCVGDMRTLSGLPAGGVFTLLAGPGVLNGNVLTATGAGEIAIQYLIGQNGCTAIALQSITSQPVPDVNFVTAENTMCLEQSLPLMALPAGGVFEIISGPGVLQADTLTASAEGVITVRYTLTQNGCTDFAEKQVTVLESPQPVITADTSSMCAGDSRLLSAMPEGGVFTLISGPGIIENNILTATSAGVIQVHYAVGLEGCFGEIAANMHVSPLPVPVIHAADTICNGQAVALSGEPTGGLFEIVSGPGIVLEDVMTTLDTGIIEYLYTVVENNCSGAVQGELVVAVQPTATVVANDDILSSTSAAAAYQWVRCDFNYTGIEGAVESNYTATETGSYAVILLDGSCVDTSACVEVEITSAGHAGENPEFTIYPNPAKEVVYINGLANAHSFRVRLTDIHCAALPARQTIFQDKVSIDVSALPAGMYILAVEVRGKRNYFRISKV